MSREVDCVIVGAGLAGATLAIGLAELGLSVVTVDARSRTPDAPGRDVRGLALAPATRNLFARLGLWPAIAREANPLTDIVITERGQFGSTHLRGAELGVPALGWVCPADRLLGHLDAALMNLGTCTPCWHASVSGIEPGPERLALDIVHADDGRSERVATRLLVAADGLHSIVREHFGIGATSHDYEQTAIVANADVARPQPHTAFERFTRDGPLAVLPLGGRRVVVVRAARTAEVPTLMHLSDEAFLADVQQRFGERLGRFTALGERRSHALILNRAQALVAPRTVLVGNAANTIHPNGAQGLNLGLRDVATLLDCIATALERDGDIGSVALLDGYARRRKPDQDRTVQFSDGLARAFGLDLGPINALRGAGLFACDLLPPLKHALMWRLMGLRGETNPWLRAPEA